MNTSQKYARCKARGGCVYGTETVIRDFIGHRCELRICQRCHVPETPKFRHLNLGVLPRRVFTNIFGPLDREFSFTLDPCAVPATAKCARYFTEADDGLAQNWGHERVFMNPPYGKEIYAWTRKARESAKGGALVVGLLPASSDLAWWHEDVLAAGAEIRFIRGRVRFLTGGPYRASGFFASVVVIWKPQ